MDNKDSRKRKRPSPCQCCGRRVARHRGSSLRYRHKCPHGRNCPAGDPLWGSYGIALNKECDLCNRARLAAGGEFKSDA
jgi:hypothetical protein